MTACATETARVRRVGFTIAADSSYAACLAKADDGWQPERWTLSGPQPYIVRLPGNRPEKPGSTVLPLPDGRVLILRRAAWRHDFALLYPTGPDTGELPLGSLSGDTVTLLPPLMSGAVFALTCGTGVSEVWLVHGGAFERRASLPGRCTGGVWLDGTGRTLALDQEIDGRTKAVAVDLELGEADPLLQITEKSNDRLLLAEPESGLLLLRSDAPGEDRLGWGVLGSRRPVRFPDSLHLPGTTLLPFAAQPGQILLPEACAVALRVEGTASTLGVWRPDDRRVTWLAGPEGWLPGSGMWTRHGTLRLPYSCGHCPCGLVDYDASQALPEVTPESGDDTARGPAPEEEGPRTRSVLPLQQAPLDAVTGETPVPVV